MPTKKPRGRALIRVQKAAHRRIARRRVRLEHVNSRVKRGRMVHDTNRLRKAGVRNLALQPNFQVLSPSIKLIRFRFEDSRVPPGDRL